MTASSLSPLDLDRLRELLDRQAVLDCIHRYCRGVDRLDADLVRSAYHRDAIDDHGLFRGSPDEFVEWAFAFHRDRHHGHQHHVTTHTCELDGDTAHAETYYMMVGQNATGTPVTLHGGRYVDRLERRDGRWGIVHRVSLLEWVGGTAPPEMVTDRRTAPGVVARDRSDTSYERPLRGRPD